jgi:HPt (histidine-containing phosphotransfer) domain-containing protein
MEEQLLDLSVLYQLANNDQGYINEVLRLYLENVPEGLQKLEKAVRKTNDFELIQRSAHAIKASASIIKIRKMHDNLAKIESMARDRSDKTLIVALLDDIVADFKEALPLIIAEKARFMQ